jgi:hypothetical protein
VDAAYNRWSVSEEGAEIEEGEEGEGGRRTKILPRWFIDDEKRHSVKLPPPTPEIAAKYRAVFSFFAFIEFIFML